MVPVSWNQNVWLVKLAPPTKVPWPVAPANRPVPPATVQAPVPWTTFGSVWLGQPTS